MHTLLKIVGLLYGVAFLCCGALQAQTPADAARATNQGNIQQFEQRRLEEERKKQFLREQDALKTEIPQPPPAIDQEGPCIGVDTINVEGVTVFDAEMMAAITAAYAGRCLTLAEINALSQDISNLYIDAGYVTSRAYIPEQDLSTRILKIIVVEGRREGFRLAPDSGDLGTRQISTAFPGRDGDLFNLRDFEQGLDQINRLASNKATMEIEPGAKPGGSLIILKNQRTKPWHARTGIDNSGLPNTGELQGFAELSYDNLLDINDLLSLSAKQDLSSEGRKESRNFSFRYELPLGYWNLSYGLSYFDYISEVSTPGADFETTGRSRVHTVDIRRVIHRDQHSRTTLSGGLVARESENYIDALKLDASSQKISILNAGIAHSRQIPAGFIYGALTYSQGLDILGAHEDTNPQPEDPIGQFRRLTADISAIKIWDFGWAAFNPQTDLTIRGQWSPDELFGSEQISIGGPFSVRGFKETSLSGESGAYARLDISIPLSITPENGLAPYIGTIRPFFGFDSGAIKSDSKSATEGGRLQSWSLGLKNERGKLDFDLTYSRPVSSPAFLNEESHNLQFSASLSF